MSSTAKHPDAIRPVIDWVLAQALRDFRFEGLFTGTAERLVAAGYPLLRLHVTIRVLHPIYAGTAFTWVRNRGLELDAFERSGNSSDMWLRSPLRYMLENRIDHFRLRIHKGEGLDDYPFILDMKAQGATDYLAMLTPFGDPATAIEREDGTIISWASQAAGGWTDQEVSDICRLQSRLAVVVRLAMQQTLAQDVVAAYLGPDAGRRVLAGQIQRGDGEDIDAVIWFSDLRSSTRLAESLGKEAFLALLNHFFEYTAGAAQAANGEILDYIGDSVLAIFPFEKFGGPAKSCLAALAAASQAAAGMAEFNRQRQADDEEPLGFGIGLHPGTAMFGNTGTPHRLKFTVVGRAVNEAARITDKCRDLDEEIVVSEKFRDITGGDWRPLGKFDLRNVNKPMALFAPD